MISQSFALPDAISPLPTATCQYVYGIIPTDDLAIFEVEGIDPAHEVHTVVEGDLAIVTSGVDDDNFQGMDRATAVRYLSAHQRVLETVMRDYPVLPVKFGTTLPGEAALHTLLRQGNRLLRETLSAYAHKEQHEVVVLWDLQKVFLEISSEGPIAALQAQIAGRAPDQTLNERVALGQLVYAAMQRRQSQISEQMIAQLRDIADDLIINPTMNDSMVINVALLIENRRQGDLDDRLGLLDTQFGGRLQIRCVGPLPPYSFATLDVKTMPFEAIDVARQQLGLGETTSANAIKRTYRQLAAHAHPDTNPDAGASAQMEMLSAAYQLLTALAKAQAPSDEISDWDCRLDREAVESTLLLSVIRQEHNA